MQKISIKDKNYPELLKKIPNPPPELYFEGDLRAKEKYPLAVVGTRKISDYGRQATEYFVKALARAGLTIVSGLALGVDGLAHQAALQVGGRTIAVLGSGLNNIYPSAHRKLAEKIIKSGGAVITEYPPDASVFKGNFPARNRIISGLCLGVLIIEAPKKSGALITAELAIKQRRKVFAVPGRIYDSNSAGANELIRMGARAATEPEHILQELNITPALDEKTSVVEGAFKSQEQDLLLKFLSQKPVHIDELTRQCKIETNKIISSLTIMEVNGIIKDLGDGYYVKT